MLSVMKTKQLKAGEPHWTGKMGLVARFELTPLDVSLWEELANRVKKQNDFLSTGSLEVIIAGLKAVAAAKKEPKPNLSPRSTGQFSRLAKAYNNPKLLKE